MIILSEHIKTYQNMHAGEHHDLEPPRGRDGLKRRKAARRNVGELQVLRDGEVARETDSSLNRDDVEESEHRRAAVFDFHDLVRLRLGNAGSFPCTEGTLRKDP